jgi:class 3 adenylate cyclase
MTPWNNITVDFVTYIIQNKQTEEMTRGKIVAEDADQIYNEPTAGSKALRIVTRQFSLRNIYLLLLVFFLVSVALAVWGMSYRASTKSIQLLMSRLQVTTSTGIAKNLDSIFVNAENMNQQVADYVWAATDDFALPMNDTDKDKMAKFMYSVLKPNYKAANSLNYIKPDGTIFAITYVPGVLTEWRTTQSHPDAGWYRAYINVTTSHFKFIMPSYGSFINYTTLPSYNIAQQTPGVPEAGMMMNVTIDLTGSGNVLTSYARVLKSRATEQVIGVAHVIFYVSTIKNLLIEANPSKKGGFIALIQDDLTLVADSSDTTVTSTAPCASNSTGIPQLCKLIRSVGGVRAFGFEERILEVEGIGTMRVVMKTVNRGLQNWNIFTALPDAEYYETVRKYSYNTIYMCIGIIVGFALVSTLCLILIMRPLYKLLVRMELVKSMRLEEILAKGNRKSFVSEVRDLESVFYDLVVKLDEYKAFLPSHILSRDFGGEEEEDIEETKEDQALLKKHDTQQIAENPVLQNIVNQTRSIVDDMSSRTGTESVSRGVGRGKNMFALGLSGRQISVLVVRIANQPDLMNRYSLSDIVTQHGKLTEKILVQACKGRFGGELVKLSHDSFIIAWNVVNTVPRHSNCACKAALDIKEVAEKLVKEMSANQRFDYPMRITMGIATGDSFSGNMGTNSKRQLCTFGDAVFKADVLSKMNTKFGTTILINEAANSKITNNMTTRPAFHLVYDDLKSSTKKEQSNDNDNTTSEEESIFELVEFKNFNSDEWMYEMEQKKQLDRFKDYNLAYQLMSERKFNEALEQINLFIDQNPFDILSKNIHDLCTLLKEDIATLAHPLTYVHSELSCNLLQHQDE